MADRAGRMRIKVDEIRHSGKDGTGLRFGSAFDRLASSARVLVPSATNETVCLSVLFPRRRSIGERRRGSCSQHVE